MAAPKTHKAPKTKYATVLYHRVVQLEVPRDPSLPPLSPEEQAAHDRNVQALRSLRRDEATAAERAHAHGLLLLDARHSALWMRVPDAKPSFFSWACSVTGHRDRSTPWRYMQLALAFPDKGHIHALVHDHHVSLSTLLTIVAADPRFHDQLLELAKGGVHGGEMHRLVEKIELELWRVEHPATEDPVEQAHEALALELDRILQEQREAHAAHKRAERAARAAGLCPRCMGSGATEKPTQPAQDLEARLRALHDREAQLQQAQAQLQADQAQLQLHIAQAQQQLAQDREALAQQRADLARDRQVLDADGLPALRAEVAALCAQRDGAQGSLAALQADLDQARDTLARAAAVQHLQGQLESLTQQTAAVQAHLAHLQADRDALALQEDLLSERGLHLDARAADLDAREAALEARDLELLHQANRLYDFQQTLVDRQKDVHNGEAALALSLHKLAREDARMIKNWLTADRGLLHYPEYLENLDMVLLKVLGLFDHLRFVLGLGFGKHDRGEMLEWEEPTLIIRVMRAQASLDDNLTHLLRLMGARLTEKNGSNEWRDKAIYAQLDWEEKHRFVTPLPIQYTKTPLPSFALPTAVVVGENNRQPAQHGVLALTAGDNPEAVMLSLGLPMFTLLAGLQGYGKTMGMLVLLEMLIAPHEHINTLRQAAAALWIHYGARFASPGAGVRRARLPNREVKSQYLLNLLGASPKGVQDVEVWVPPLGEEQLSRRRQEYAREGIDRVAPFEFTFQELGITLIRLLMDAAGNPAQYLERFNKVFRELWEKKSGQFVMAELREALKRERWKKGDLDLLEGRLDKLGRFAGFEGSVTARVKPGTLYVADLRSDTLAPEEAGYLVTALTQAFSAGAKEDELRGIFVDEMPKFFNKAFKHPDELMVEVTEIRHRRKFLVGGGQDLGMLPDTMVKLAHNILHGRTDSSDSLSHLGSLKEFFKGPELARRMAALEVGEFMGLFRDATDEKYTKEPQLLRLRPSLCAPSGTTVVAGSLPKEEPQEEPAPAPPAPAAPPA